MSKQVNVPIEVRVRRLHNVQGVSVQEVAQRLNIPTKKVQNIINPNNMAGKTTTAADRKRRKREVKKLHAEGYTQANIAEMLGCGLSTVQRDLGVRWSKKPRKKASAPKASVAKQVRQSTKPQTGMVKEYSILWGAFKFVKRG
jgi:transposase